MIGNRNPTFDVLGKPLKYGILLSIFFDHLVESDQVSEWVLVLDLRVLRLVISLLILPSSHLLGDQMKSFLNLLSALKFCRIKTLAYQPLD